MFNHQIIRKLKNVAVADFPLVQQNHHRSPIQTDGNFQTIAGLAEELAILSTHVNVNVVENFDGSFDESNEVDDNI